MTGLFDVCKETIPGGAIVLLASCATREIVILRCPPPSAGLEGWGHGLSSFEARLAVQVHRKARTSG